MEFFLLVKYFTLKNLSHQKIYVYPKMILINKIIMLADFNKRSYSRLKL